jgi:hypothetical protein
VSDRTRARRLAGYAALAGGLVPAAAGGEIIARTGLDLEITNGHPVSLDDGRGISPPFWVVSGVRERFTSYRTWTSAFGTGYVRKREFRPWWVREVVFWFNPGNTGGWTRASALSTDLDYLGVVTHGVRPLATSYVLGPNNDGWARMTSSYGHEHHLAGAYGWSGGAWGRSYFYGGDGTFLGSNWDWYGEYGGTAGAFGPFLTRGYAALSFSNGVDTHYMWVDVSANPLDHVVTIHGYAVEEEPGRPLHVPTPSVLVLGLALLAMGAGGIRRYRGLTV